LNAFKPVCVSPIFIPSRIFTSALYAMLSIFLIVGAWYVEFGCLFDATIMSYSLSAIMY